MSRFQNIKNLVCLVSGGASGLGRSTCELLAQRGAKIVIADLPKAQNEGEQLVKRLGEQNALFAQCDVTDSQQVEQAMQLARKQFGQLDVAVANAGIALQERTYNFKKGIPHSPETFERVMRVNTWGAFNVARLAAQQMAKNQPDGDGQRGVIIMTASIAAYSATSGFTAYAASKGAVASMTLPMARDLAGVGIRVVSIAPGPFKTPMLSSGFDALAELAAKLIPFPKRPGNPKEFAGLVEHIIGNTMLNGCVLRIDGAFQ